MRLVLAFATREASSSYISSGADALPETLDRVMGVSEFDELEGDRRRGCAFCRAREALSDDDRKLLEDHVGGDYSHTTFVKWFARRDLKVSDKAVAKHRKGECLGV